MASSNLEILEHAAHLFRQSEATLFITGAGISVDSGLPTYRGVGGLYHDKETEDGMPIEDALSGSTFARKPDLTWKYLWQIGEACAGAQPNAAHHVIAELEKEKPIVTVMTQNVDGLHRDAGSQDLVEVHGNMHQLYCTTCGIRTDSRQLFEEMETTPELPLRCKNCHGIIRPDVVLFGEFLGSETVAGLDRISKTSYDLVVSIGTSAVFPYILEPVLRAVEAGKPTIEINPGHSELSGMVALQIPLGAAEALTRIAGRLAEGS